MKSYVVYKGLQKPLVFRGLKGRFILMITGFIFSIFALGILLYVLFGIMVCLIFLGVYGTAGGVKISMESKKGLYPKKKEKNIIKINKIL